MRLLSFVILILGFQASADNGVKEKPFYGDEIKSESATSLDSVLKDYAKYEKSSLVMEANVEKVCAAKGCWMTLQGSDKTFLKYVNLCPKEGFV